MNDGDKKTGNKRKQCKENKKKNDERENILAN